MKKVTSIFLLGLLLYNMLGYFFVFEIQRYFERNEMYSGVCMSLPNETIVSFKIPLIGYPQPDHELTPSYEPFTYDGKYYSMSKQWIKNDTLIIEAFENVHREKLEESLYNHVREHIIEQYGKDLNRTPLEKSKRILAFFLKDYLPENKIQVPNFSIHFIIQGVHVRPENTKISTRFLEIASPPPQFV